MKTMVLIGGARGIGAHMVRYFAKNGWRVLFCFQNSLEAAQRLSLETGALHAACDVRDEAQVRALFDRAACELRHIDALVCCAGASWSGLTEEMPLDAYRRVMDTNMGGAFLCARAALPFLRDSGGAMVLVSSMWGVAGASCESVYSASKAALCNFARALAKEVGPSGVRVNCVAPGAVDTDMMAGYSDADKADLAARAPLGRLCEREDVTNATDFLLSDKAAFITGQTLVVDGGLTL